MIKTFMSVCVLPVGEGCRRTLVGSHALGMRVSTELTGVIGGLQQAL